MLLASLQQCLLLCWYSRLSLLATRWAILIARGGRLALKHSLPARKRKPQVTKPYSSPPASWPLACTWPCHRCQLPPPSLDSCYNSTQTHSMPRLLPILHKIGVLHLNTKLQIWGQKFGFLKDHSKLLRTGRDLQQCHLNVAPRPV